jgi:hypothetical protein
VQTAQAVTDLGKKDIMRLAAESGLDPRTVKRAVENGVDSLHAELDRERLRAAAKALKVALK